ncbi:MAG: LysR family transcriptional regulator [Pirellulales bacterium]|nr:LysR family transcriptional regulator [Pirellulales bacterium]
MQLRSLKVFCDVVARRSFSRAADENGISQSAASQVVHQLEDRMSVKLIDRSKRPFVLTPEGEAYYGGCRKLVERYLALEDRVRTMHNDVAGRVSVASIYSVGLHHMNCFIQEFMGQHPKANVRLEYQHPRRVLELVEHDQVDLGLVSYPKSSRTLDAIQWRSEPMALIVAPDHPLATCESVNLAQLDGEKMVGFDSDLTIRREIDRVLADSHVDVGVVMEFDNIETIKRAIEINTGIGLLPAPTVVREVSSGTLVSVPLAGEPLKRPLGIVYRRGRQLSNATSEFIEFLKSKTNGTADSPAEDISRGSNGRNGHDATELVAATK